MPLCLRAYASYVLSFFYVPYMPWSFYVPHVPSFLGAYIFVRGYILFMYILIKLTQINERTLYYSSLLLENSAIY